MASTATSTPGNQPFLRRTISMAHDSESSAPPTAVASPFDSPRPSASSTSLSSLGSEDGPEIKADYGTLLDLDGNPFVPPDFTIKEIRDAIPEHCFVRSPLKGFAYIARDMLCLATTFYVFHTYVTPELVPSKPARAGLWALYTFLQGLFGTGLWVIGHECGHGAFSPSRTLNDVTGWVLHSALLVPFFSWKLSHSAHHKATGNMDRDMVFVPKTREVRASRMGRLAHELGELTEETPLYTLIMLLGQQLIGWQNYLLANVTGHDNHENQREGRGKGKKNGLFGGVNHFNPNSPLYDNRHSHQIVYSNIGITLAAAGLYYLGNRFGWSNMVVWYFIPYFWVHHWLVAITFLQHTDPSLPHYTSDQWNFVRGAAATIDRDMGFIGRHLFHGIVETHVLHHYVSSIPFYNAEEASEAIRGVMGKHYRADTRGGALGFVRALWTAARTCQWVEPSRGATKDGQGILFFRNHNGRGEKPMNAEEWKAYKASLAKAGN